MEATQLCIFSSVKINFTTNKLNFENYNELYCILKIKVLSVEILSSNW